MLSSLLITLREGLEAALIIGIILAYLDRTGNRQGFKHVWIGTSLAILVSVISGAGIFLVAEEFSGRAEEIFEGLAMFTAVGVLIWMIFWMRRQAVNIKAHCTIFLLSRICSRPNGGRSLNTGPGSVAGDARGLRGRRLGGNG